MTRVSIAAEEQGVEVDLWGEDFVLLPAIRSRSKKARPLYDQLSALEKIVVQAEAGAIAMSEVPEDADDQMVAIMGKLLDIITRPAGGKSTKASTLVGKKWKGDELTLDQLMGFLDRLSEANSPPR